MPVFPVSRTLRTPRSSLVRAAGALATLLALGACAGNVSRPVSEDARDTDGRHDGVWVAKVDAPAGQQNIEGWHFKCEALKFEWGFEVSDGVARLRFTDDGEDTLHEAFVDGDGRFRLEIPLSERARASGGSDSQISDGAIKLILEGDLGDDDPRGFYVVGIRDFLYRGCRQRVDYDRIDA